MYVHRAIASCPACNEPSEIWYYKSKVTPFHTIECVKCSKLYDPNNFVTNLLDLYKNVTVSAINLAG